MDKYLIINADDFGMCRSANLAIFDLLKKGGITSATIMPPCGWSPEAVQFAKDNPEFGIGIHLTTTSEWSKYRWAPVGKGPNESLRDEEGFMHKGSKAFEQKADLDEVEAELRAQIALMLRLGLKPSHLDNHMGSLYGIEDGRFELLTLTIDLAGEMGLPFRFPTKFTTAQYENQMLGISVPKEIIENLFSHYEGYGREKGVAMIDYLMPGDWGGPQKESFENFREYIYELYKTFEPGVTETYIHPALESDELKGTTSLWQYRVWEYELFADPKTRQHIEACGIKLINYRDLQKIKFG